MPPKDEDRIADPIKTVPQDCSSESARFAQSCMSENIMVDSYELFLAIFLQTAQRDERVCAFPLLTNSALHLHYLIKPLCRKPQNQ